MHLKLPIFLYFFFPIKQLNLQQSGVVDTKYLSLIQMIAQSMRRVPTTSIMRAYPRLTAIKDFRPGRLYSSISSNQTLNFLLPSSYPRQLSFSLTKSHLTTKKNPTFIQTRLASTPAAAQYIPLPITNTPIFSKKVDAYKMGLRVDGTNKRCELFFQVILFILYYSINLRNR